MITINLLPEELREIERTRRFRINVAKISGVAIVIIVIALIFVFYKIGQRMHRLAEVKARLVRLKPASQKAEALIKEKKQIENELSAVNSFSTRRLLWNRQLNEISDCVPEDIMLVSLTYHDTTPFTLIIGGRAPSRRGGERVVEFIDNLRCTRDFIGEFPHIDYSIESLPTGLKSFEIRCARMKGKDGKG